MTSRPRTHFLRFDLWPAVDQAAWRAIVHDGGPFGPAGPGVSWAASTREAYVQAYGRWLHHLSATGQLDPSVAPGTRVTAASVRGFLEQLQGLADYTILTLIDSLYSVIRAMAPATDWGWLHRVRCHLRQEGPRSRPKHQRVLDSKRIFDAGLALIAEASTIAHPKRRAAVFRDGLMLALLASRPLRRVNFAAISLGEHLVRVGEGWRLQFAASEMKNRRRLELPLPSRLAEPTSCYIEEHRPALLRGRVSDRLWISTWGNPMTGHAIYIKVVEVTTKCLGRPLYLHLFRHCLATSLAIRDPQHVRMATTLLGQNRPRTTEEYYNQAQSLEAGRMFQRDINSIRPALRNRGVRTR
jgi:site-specific recombinase XerD